MRILIKFAYNGSNYSGYQKQDNAASIQQTIEQAFSEKLGQQIKLCASGRTDAKVHALCQCAHFDCDIKFSPEKFVEIAKCILPEDIVVYQAKQVADDFDARKDVKRKTYMYVYAKKRERIPFTYNFAPFLERCVNIEKMKLASKQLLGTNNFKAFCASGSQVKTFERTIYSVDIEDTTDFLTFKITGNGFLYNMVRIIVGTLMDIGSGLLEEGAIQKMLKTGDRKHGGRTAKAQGLYLFDVEY
ncbi:MAG: tRNA pseudouridine(38-40) synthase TruA [Clostridia bacterium]|nr:tRNA pseudouridine(38-40) synthase TruA [Clostridia bacterium]